MRVIKECVAEAYLNENLDILKAIFRKWYFLYLGTHNFVLKHVRGLGLFVLGLSYNIAYTKPKRCV